MFLVKNKLFHVCVTIPTIIAIYYFGFVASDIYTSESQFQVRTSEKQAFSGLGAFLKSSGFVRSTDDAYTVENYILSRDAMNILNERLKIKQKFSVCSIWLKKQKKMKEENFQWEIYGKYLFGDLL